MFSQLAISLQQARAHLAPAGRTPDLELNMLVIVYPVLVQHVMDVCKMSSFELIEPIDGERVLVASGLDAGRRIVVNGAELIDHVR